MGNPACLLCRPEEARDGDGGRPDRQRSGSMKTGSPFVKYLYWLDPARQGEAIEELRRDRRGVYRVRQQPCEALYPRRDLVLVEPRAWDLRCRRQGSWYRASPRSGHFLLVTGSPSPRFPLWGSVSLEEFRPPRVAADADVLELLSDPCLPEVAPPGWGDFSPWEEEALREFLREQGVEMSLQKVFCYYTANHLNFVRPRFFVESGGNPVVPYSIQDRALVCSACVELFGILGGEFGLKYLAPCPGLKYVEPAAGEFLRLVVENPGR